MMNVTEARKAMLDFVNRNKGKSILFSTLNDADKLIYVMVKSFTYYTFLKGSERVKRAIENAYAHKKSNFEVYADRPTEHLVVTRI